MVFFAGFSGLPFAVQNYSITKFAPVEISVAAQDHYMLCLDANLSIVISARTFSIYTNILPFVKKNSKIFPYGVRESRLLSGEAACTLH